MELSLSVKVKMLSIIFTVMMNKIATAYVQWKKIKQSSEDILGCFRCLFVDEKINLKSIRDIEMNQNSQKSLFFQ